MFSDTEPKNAHYFSMDDDELISRLEPRTFELENQTWHSVEHYYQSKKFENASYQALVATSETPQKARKYGKTWLHRKVKKWPEKRVVMMTRAVYTQCKTYPELAQKLLDTEDQMLVENSQFDYFWGCGRDHRGENQYGKMLMGVRSKLRES
ncbi:MAG: NADAR family protein [Pseudomonadota bacterium]